MNKNQVQHSSKNSKKNLTVNFQKIESHPKGNKSKCHKPVTRVTTGLRNITLNPKTPAGNHPSIIA